MRFLLAPVLQLAPALRIMPCGAWDRPALCFEVFVTVCSPCNDFVLLRASLWACSRGGRRDFGGLHSAACCPFWPGLCSIPPLLADLLLKSGH